ncbi:MAG: hypothetical protein ACTSPB_24635 [Candidatus Thorarchaeota archaeon]
MPESINPNATEICNGKDDDCDDIIDNGGDSLCDDELWCNGQEICAGELGCQPGTPINCDDGNECTDDICNEDLDVCENPNSPYGTLCGEARDCPDDRCNGFYAEFYPDDGHDYCDGLGNCVVYSCELEDSYCTDNDPFDGIDTLECGAQCDQDSDCPANSCSETYYDYCDGRKLVEYDNDKILDSTTINDSCENTCSGCLCTNCSVDCSPPETNEYCVEGLCNAQCDQDSDCPPTDCDYLDGCVGNDYYDYDDVPNNCLDSCLCEQNECGQPTIYPNDPRCTECQTDDDCNELDRDYCDGDLIKHDEGRCIDYSCEVEITVVYNCNDNNYYSCSGDWVVYNDYTCSNAECVLDNSTPEEDCNNYDNTYCNGTEIWQDDGYCVDGYCEIDSYMIEDCDDGLYCNGQETCEDAQCIQGTPVNCDDSVSCTVDSCNEELDRCEHNPDDSLCPSDTVCADYYCDAELDCQVNYEPPTKLCRQSAGICDIPEYCTGSSPECPEDVFKPNTTECRPASGVCDVAEYCTGSGPDCPENQFKPYGTDCGVCAACDGLGNCNVYDETQDSDCPPTICEDSCFIDVNPFTWDYAEDVPNECIGLFTCSQYSCEYQHECSIGLCGAECENDSDCDDGNEYTKDVCSDCLCEHIELPDLNLIHFFKQSLSNPKAGDRVILDLWIKNTGIAEATNIT